MYPISYTQNVLFTDLVPVISPPGFNASEDAEGVVVFRCSVTHLISDPADPTWLINDTPTSYHMQGDRGIYWDEFMKIENETTYIEIRIRPTSQNNGTHLQCRVILPSDTVLRSQKVLLRVQGKILQRLMVHA